MSNVLVTGGSGFLARHVILQLVGEGHVVRTTLRDLAREPEVRASLQSGGMHAEAHLEFARADLERDDGWADAIDGCEYVLHVASPFPATSPKDENELIVPARDGTLRVLRAARSASVRRVVMTSSFAAVGYGHDASQRTFSESDWTDPRAADVQPYIKSKTLAERAAWEFVSAQDDRLELTAINPVGIFGPMLGSDFAGSIGMIKQLLDGAMPAVPQLYFGVVDVRDVAALHVRAMSNPAANGERFIATSGPPVAFVEVARMLRRRLGASARRVPTREMPIWLTRLLALGVPRLRELVPQLGIVRNASNEKARTLLGWQPRSAEDAVIAAAESLIAHQLVRR